MVSCRRKEDIEQFLEGSSGLGMAGKPPVYVTISEFSYEEFFAVCTAADVHPGAKAMLLTASGLGAKTITLSQSGRLDPIGRDFDSTVTASIDLLRHPVVWQCYRLLAAEDQSAFLRQDDTAVRKLSENYTQEFWTRKPSN